MRKTFFLLILSAGLLSCSSDHDEDDDLIIERSWRVDLCGFSQTQYQIGASAGSVDVTADEPFAILDYNLLPAGPFPTVLDSINSSWWAIRPDSLVRYSQTDYVTIERDNDRHARITFEENTGRERTCSIVAYNPLYKFGAMENEVVIVVTQQGRE